MFSRYPEMSRYQKTSVKRIIVRCIGVFFAIAVLMAVSSCTSDTKGYAKDTYKVTMYSGGEVVREWHGVSDYVRFSDVGFTLTVDGTYVGVVGDVVIELE